MKLAVTHCKYLCNQPSCINSRLNIQVKFHSSSTLNTCVKSQWLPITHALNKTFFIWLKPVFLHTSINGFHGFFTCLSHCFCLKSEVWRGYFSNEAFWILLILYFAANLASLKIKICTLYITAIFHNLTQRTLATCQDRVLASSEFYLIAWSEW